MRRWRLIVAGCLSVPIPTASLNLCVLVSVNTKTTPFKCQLQEPITNTLPSQWLGPVASNRDTRVRLLREASIFFFYRAANSRDPLVSDSLRHLGSTHASSMPRGSGWDEHR